MPTPAIDPYKVSAAHAAHVELGAQWDSASSWRIPLSYGDPQGEARAARDAAGLLDVSNRGKLDLKGGGVDEAIRAVAGREAISSILRTRPGHRLVLTPPDAAGPVADALRRLSPRPSHCVHVTDVTSAFTALALVGPHAGAVLSRLTALDLRPTQFPDTTCAQGELAKVHATVVREAWGALPAFIVLVGRDVGEYVWHAMSSAGASLGLTPIGTAAAFAIGGRPTVLGAITSEVPDPKPSLLNPA